MSRESITRFWLLKALSDEEVASSKLQMTEFNWRKFQIIIHGQRETMEEQLKEVLWSPEMKWDFYIWEIHQFNIRIKRIYRDGFEETEK